MTGRPTSDHGHIWQQGQSASRRPEGRAGAARSQAGRRPPRRPRWLALAGYGGLTVVCLCLAAVAFLVVAPPVDAIRDRLIEQVQARTGRTLVIAGPASLSFYPRVSVALSNVALSGPEGTQGPPMLAVPSVDVEVSLWSLLSRRPQLGALTLHRPTIELTVDAQGRRSWELAKPPRAPSTPIGASGSDLQPPAKPAGSARPKPAKGLERLGAGSVRIVDATLRYRDERSGAGLEISGLDLVAAASELEDPVALAGSLVWRGVRVGFSARALPLRAILSDQPFELALELSGAPVEAAYDGILALKGGISADGNVTIRAPSAQALSDWLGTAWPAGSADALAVSGRVTAVNGEVTLSSLEASSGDVSLAGSLAVDIKGRPSISGKLQISEFDLGKLPVRWHKRADVPAGQPSSGPAAAPQVDKLPSRKDWSDRTIDARILGFADADLALSVERIVYRDMKTGRSTLSVSVKDGVAKFVLQDVELYGGRGQGRLTLDGSGGTLMVGTDLKLAGVSLLPLLNDTAGVAWLDGRGTISLALSGQGLSQRQIVQSLNGKVDVAVAEGAITGIDVGKLLRAIERGRLPSLAPAPEDRTPFSELTGTFDITDGTARSRDLKLVGTQLQLKGEGTIELGPRQIDYTLRTKIAGGPPAEGAAFKIGTLEVPIGIKGPLEAPEFTIKGYEELTGTLKQIGKNLRSREVQDAIKGLLSGDRDKRVKPQELIDKLLKKE